MEGTYWAVQALSGMLGLGGPPASPVGLEAALQKQPGHRQRVCAEGIPAQASFG